MDGLFSHYAKCNSVINQEMMRILETLGEDPFELALGGYYFKTLGHILEHVYVSDMNWMKEFTKTTGFTPVPEEAVGEIPPYGSQVFSKITLFKAQRIKLDNYIQTYMDAIGQDGLAKRVSRQTRNNGLIERDLWKALVHFFNHQTHHRGQVSHYLDEKNIENNFSNMITIE